MPQVGGFGHKGRFQKFMLGKLMDFFVKWATNGWEEQKLMDQSTNLLRRNF